MRLLYLDESGSHGAALGNRAYVLAGVSVGEADAQPLQDALTAVVAKAAPPGVTADELELHAAELLHPRREFDSKWRYVHDGRVRQRVVRDALAVLLEHPVQLFVATGDPDVEEIAERAYEAVLNRFDDSLRDDDHGVAISDVGHNAAEELRLQVLSDRWRRVAGRMGRLDRLVDVLLFSDSRASRLLQAADLVAWAMWRRVGAHDADPRWSEPLMERLELLRV